MKNTPRSSNKDVGRNLKGLLVLSQRNTTVNNCSAKRKVFLHSSEFFLNLKGEFPGMAKNDTSHTRLFVPLKRTQLLQNAENKDASFSRSTLSLA